VFFFVSIELEKLRPHEVTHQYLYNCLNILDSKAIALLTYDSVSIVAATFALSPLNERFTLGRGIVFLGLLLSAASSLVCLLVIWIFWAEEHQESDDLSQLSIRLLRERNKRTVAYRWACVVSLLAMVVLIVGILVRISTHS
jgi:hypothetical protein